MNERVAEPVETLTQLEDLGLESFTSCLGSVFQAAYDSDHVMPLELIEAKDLGSSERLECFSLLFRSPGMPEMQGIWRLSHASLGTFELFLVAVGRAEAAFLYEAIFSRIAISDLGAA